jgi:twinkle protein
MSENVKIYKIEDCQEEMLYDLRHGKEKGTTTHIKDLDNAWTWRRQEFNIWTGYANEGKTQFVKFLTLAKTLSDNWKATFCAPEDIPVKEFYDDMVHTVSGFSTDTSNPRRITEKMYKETIERIRDRIFFLYVKPPENTIERTLDEFSKIKSDIYVIDPILKFARPSTFASDRDDRYAAYIGSMCVDFCREHNCSLHLTMHQNTPSRGDDKKYPEPSMYNVKGGGSWADGADNVLSIWRPHYATDKLNNEVQFSSQKIKKQKLVGIPQKIKYKFNRKSNRYIDYTTEKDIYNF